MDYETSDTSQLDEPDNNLPPSGPPIASRPPKVIQPSQAFIEQFGGARNLAGSVASPEAVAPTEAVAVPPPLPTAEISIPTSPTLPPQITPTPTPQLSPPPTVAPVDAVGGNLNPTEVTTPSKLPLLIAVGVIVIAAIGSYLYLPVRWAHTYQTNVTAQYAAQSTAMTTVYQSFSRPVFSNVNSTPQGDAVDLAYTANVIKTATTATTTLKSHNHLITLPLTGWLPGVSRAKRDHASMTRYIDSSQAFLTNYQTLVTYITQLEQIEPNQVAQMNTAVNAMVQSKSAAQLLATSQNASAAIAAFVSVLNTLHPPTDLQPFNSSLISGYIAMNSALQQIDGGIENGDQAEMLSGVTALDQGAAKLVALSSTNYDAVLQNASSIERQIKALEATYPLS